MNKEEILKKLKKELEYKHDIGGRFYGGNALKAIMNALIYILEKDDDE